MRLNSLSGRPQPIWPALAACLSLPGAACPAVSAPVRDQAETRRFDLETSDGVSLATWYYEPSEDAAPLATVILVHDFEGSHKSVEPLALALREAGCTVAVPDLRGHGASKAQEGHDADLEIRQLRKSDLELIAAGAGGRLREQSAVRGDLETVHRFLASRGAAGGSAEAPLVVIGCGAGATLAALWTAADWAWPPLASGPQGQEVKALVLVSPAWAAKGLTIQPALGTDAIRREIPLLVLVGKADRDGIRLFEQLKQKRPREWFDQRADKEFTKAKEVEKPDDATLFLVQFDTTLSGEKLAAEADTAPRIKTFLELVLGDDSRPRSR
ncbi:alpha/beta fold hydrolase [bacterium]|nr:alpha/beta fold hydrolase [bacterium]